MIKKREKFHCIKTMVQHGVMLFESGQLYRSKKDHSICDANGSNQFGFNKEMLKEHFLKR